MPETNEVHLQEIESCLQEAEAAQSVGNYHAGIKIARRALALARQLHLETLEGQALMLIAEQLPRQAKYENAIQEYQAAITIWRRQKHDVYLAQALNEQALIYMDIGLVDEALANLTHSMDIANATNNPSILFWAYNRTGVALSHLLKYKEARGFYMQALAYSEQLDSEAQFCIYNNLADFYAHYILEISTSKVNHQDNDESLPLVEEGLFYAQQAIKLARQSNNPYRESLILGNLGALQAFNGDFSSAEHSISLALILAQRYDYHALLIDAKIWLARIALYKGNIQQGLIDYEALLPDLLEQGEQLIVLTVYKELSEIYQQIGQTDKALEYYKCYHEVERNQRSAVAATRAKLMTETSELSETKRELERIRMHAELERLRVKESESKRHALKKVVKELKKQIHIDELTCINNRRYMMEKLKNMVSSQQGFCIALVDVDHFKQINDTFGHQKGDVILKKIAQRIFKSLPDNAMVSRHGGEEFMILFKSLPILEAHQYCDRIRQAVIEDDECQLQPATPTTISIGIGQRQPSDSLESIIERTDLALYRAKNSGRNCVVDEVLQE